MSGLSEMEMPTFRGDCRAVLISRSRKPLVQRRYSHAQHEVAIAASFSIFAEVDDRVYRIQRPNVPVTLRHFVILLTKCLDFPSVR